MSYVNSVILWKMSTGNEGVALPVVVKQVFSLKLVLIKYISCLRAEAE